MIILDGQSLTKAGWILPETMGLNIEERRSTASVQIADADAPDVPVGTWLLDDSGGPGDGIVWRVKTAETTYNTGTRTLQLEHVINTLRDLVMFGEVTPETIAGAGATSCSAEAAARYILGRQSIWQLGDFEYSVSNPYNFNGENLLSALEMVTDSLADAVWEYDLESMPFTLHIRQAPADADCEMREGRNLQTLRRSIDRSQMYTRFYPIGKDDLHIAGDYVSRNETLYGTVCRIETDQSKETEAELIRWANERLDRHCEPLVTVTISGLEMSRSTGEALDRLRINRKCRVPLPEFATTITERIIRLSWTDTIKEPEKVNVTLANKREDVASIIRRQIDNAARGNGGGGRGGMKKAKEDHAWFVDTEDHVGMVAEAIIGRDEDGVDWSRVASIIVDGDGIHQRVTRTAGYVVQLEAKVDLNEAQLRAEFENTSASLRTEIEAEAGRISLVVQGYGSEAEVKRASILLAINNGTSSAHVDADEVYIGNTKSTTVISGKLTADDITTTFLSGKIADIPVVTCKAIICQGTVAASGSVSGDIVAAGTTFALNGNSCTDLIKDASVSGNTLTLTYLSGATVNFSKAGAVTVDSITAPAAAASTEVTSTTVTATASNGATKTATLFMAKGTPSASGGYASVSLGNTVVARISLNNWFNGGYNACRDDMEAAEVYTRDNGGGYGGSGNTHYVADSSSPSGYRSVGANWYQTTRNWTYCYNKPAAK